VRILVTGAGGLVGRALLTLGRGRRLDIVGVDREACDVCADPGPTLRAHRPDVVLFCAAWTAVDTADCAAAEAVNADAPGRWAKQVPTWFLSTNFVFDGPGPHHPDTPPDPQSPYARQKRHAERAVLEAGGHVVRVGSVWGPGGRTFASSLADRLRAGQVVRAMPDRLVQPTWSFDLADALLALPTGLSHLAAAGETSWYGLALAVAARVGGTVAPIPSSRLGLSAPRPRDGRLAPATLPAWWDRLDMLCLPSDHDAHHTAWRLSAEAAPPRR
jgi:dTDP-4-dehydrorhamnose reductase